MKRVPLLLIAVLTGCMASGHDLGFSDHLVPEPGVLADGALYDYYVDVRRAFSAAYSHGVVLRSIYMGPSGDEEAVGIRETKEGYEIFVLNPSVSIYCLEVTRDRYGEDAARMSDDGTIVSTVGRESFQALNKCKSLSEGTIAVRQEAVSISASLAERILAAWEAMLLDARHEAYRCDRPMWIDGPIIHYSMHTRGNGDVSAEMPPAREGSKLWSLGELGIEMRKYAKGHSDERALERLVKPLE